MDSPCRAAPLAVPKPRTSSALYRTRRRSPWSGCSFSVPWGRRPGTATTYGEEPKPPRYTRPWRSGGLSRSWGSSTALALPTALLSSGGDFAGWELWDLGGLFCLGSASMHEMYKSMGKSSVVSLGLRYLVAPFFILLSTLKCRPFQ